MSVDNLIKEDAGHAMKRVDSMSASPDLQPASPPVESQSFESVEHETIDGQGKRYDETNLLPQNDDVDEQIKDEVDNIPEQPETKQSNQETEERTNTVEKDDYGNDIDTTPKTYSQEQVNEMMQQRADRMRKQYESQQPQNDLSQYQAPPEQQYAQQPAQTPDVASDDWEGQLNQYIDQRLADRQTEIVQRQQVQKQESDRLAHENKFMEGKNRYSDFEKTVGNPALNVTQDVFNASKTLSDPAAFFYAAAKHHPAEINRIAAYRDPMMIATELARLDERMKRPRQTRSNTPKPIANERGDISHKQGTSQLRSVDSRIQEHAQEQMKRSGR